MPRMRILNAVEQHVFDSPRIQQPTAQKVLRFFGYSQAHGSRIAIACPPGRFSHQLWLFPGHEEVFPAKNFHLQDINYVASKLGLSIERVELDEYNDRTRQKHQLSILKFYGCRAFDGKAKIFLTEEIDAMVRSQLKPRLIFWRCVDRLIQEYANSVLKSEIFQIARRHDEDRYLHVLAFIAHQYYRLQDNPG
jgi:Domain of unknown function (DUF4158)